MFCFAFLIQDKLDKERVRNVRDPNYKRLWLWPLGFGKVCVLIKIEFTNSKPTKFLDQILHFLKRLGVAWAILQTPLLLSR